MSKYKCPDCLKVFPDNYKFGRHIQRKTSCKIILDNDDIPTNDRVGVQCQYCNRYYKNYKSIQYHIKICKAKNCQIQKKIIIEKDVLLKNKEHETALILEEKNKEIAELKSQMLQVKISPMTINNTDNSTTNNTINNITINVQSMDDLRVFGNENFDYIDSEWLVKCIESNSNPKAAYKDLAEHVFFNVDHPENHNMRILDKVGPAKVIVHYNKGKWDMMDIGQALGMAGDNLRNVFQGRDGKWQGQDSAGEMLYNKYKPDHPIAKRATDVICNHTEDKFKVLDGIEDSMRDRKEVVSQTHSQLPKKDRPENVYKKMQHDKEEWNQYHGVYTQAYDPTPEDDTPLEEFESNDELFEQLHNERERELFNSRVDNPE
jgi:hypothetical protein